MRLQDTLIRTLLLTCGLLTVPLAASAAEIIESPDAIPGRYLVVLEDDAAADGLVARTGDSRVQNLARELAGTIHGRAGRTFDKAVDGFVLEAGAREIRQLSRDPRVARIYQDAVVVPTMVQSPVPSWGLDRIDQRGPDLDATYGIWSWGDRAHLYVVDSGIRSSHADFGGRVDTGASFTTVDDGLGAEDCLGHGTAVAGIAAGYEHGVAKGATLHSVRVFDCAGASSVSQVLAAIDWVTAEHQSPAIGMLSLQTAAHGLLDDAVRRSTEAGVLWVVGAGNNGGNACDYSPARVAEVLTVGATDALDDRASFSNAGACVDLWAPGVGVTTAGAGSDAQTLSFSGTSASAPYVAGVAALARDHDRRAAPGLVAWQLEGAATAFVDSAGVPGRLIYSGLEDDDLDLTPYARFTADCDARACVFDGSASFDDHGIAEYHWIVGPGLEEVSGKKVRRVRVRLPQSTGEWTRILVTLTLTDTAGQTSSLTRTVWIP